MPEPILVARATSEISLLPRFANRHGLIAGATGTGKTVTLQRLAEGFSRIGVPVFMADVKGDLAGLSQTGEFKGKIKERVEQLSNRVQQAPAAGGGFLDALGGFLGESTGPRGGRREGAIEAAAKSAARSIGSQVAREIVRGVLGSIFGGGKRR